MLRDKEAHPFILESDIIAECCGTFGAQVERFPDLPAWESEVVNSAIKLRDLLHERTIEHLPARGKHANSVDFLFDRAEPVKAIALLDIFNDLSKLLSTANTGLLCALTIPHGDEIVSRAEDTLNKFKVE